jgi:predicted AlkP superfamily phosphohydrolase/phosphomutase
MTRPRRAIATAILAIGASLACADPPPASAPSPMIVIGVDGADWAVVEELWKQDRLPALAALARDGSRAVLGTSWAASPVIWSTVATGALPSAHGITGFVEATEQGGDTPVSSTLRRVPAVWNMLTSLGRRTVVVGWWATWPAEEIDGVVVSDRLLDGVDAAFSPPTLATEIEHGLREAGATDSPFNGLDGGERDRAMAWFAYRLAHENFDLLLAYFSTPDLASHDGWRGFAPADFPPADDVEAQAAMRDRIFRAYEAVDHAIGAIVAAPGRPVNVIVLSDHGFRAARREIVRVTFDLDALLERLGYLARDSGGGVDGARSRVYTYASGLTQSNKRVRFGDAGAASSDPTGERLRAELERDLARVTWDGGEPALQVAAPTARHARQGADLLVQVQTEHAAPPLRLDGAAIDGVAGEVRRISGSHGASTDGILIAAGPDIERGARLDGIHVRDVAPTLLYGVDAPAADDFAGRAFLELYRAELRERRPLRRIPSWGTREQLGPAPTGADEKLIEELRALGYLD